MNALKHGLAAKDLVVMPGEDPAALDALRADLVAEHQPVGPTEALLVEHLALCWWRMNRGRKYEAAVINHQLLPVNAFEGDKLALVLRYATSAERAFLRALNELRAARNDRRTRQQEAAESAPAAQSQETEKVMAVGSVLQDEPEPQQPESGSAPEPAPSYDVPQATPGHTPPAIDEFMSRLARLDQPFEPVELDDLDGSGGRPQAGFSPAG